MPFVVCFHWPLLQHCSKSARQFRVNYCYYLLFFCGSTNLLPKLFFRKNGRFTIFVKSTQHYLQNKLARIQKRFLNVLFFRENRFYPTFPNNISYKYLCDMLQLQGISDRVINCRLQFINGLYNSKIDCAMLSSKCGINVPLVEVRGVNRTFFNVYVPTPFAVEVCFVSFWSTW